MFSRDDTKAVKGLAVLMMLFHHLVGFPDRYAQGFEGFETLWHGLTERGILIQIAYFSHICVSLFFFLGGYGLYLQWKAERYHLMEHIKRLYRSYWRVLLLFIPIALIFFRHNNPELPALCRIYDFQDLRGFLVNLLGDFTGHTANLNKEWWFFKAYLSMLPMGLLFCRLTKKTNSFVIDMLIVCLIDFLRGIVFQNMLGTTLFARADSNIYFLNFILTDFRALNMYLGIVFAKHDFIVRLKKPFSRLRCSWLYGLAIIPVVFYLRSYVAGSFLDFFYIPCFVVAASVFFDGIPLVKKGFMILGRYSNNLWLVHTFFCYYFFEFTKIVYCTKSPLIDWMILLGLSLGASVFVDAFWKLMKYLRPTLRKFFLKPEPQEPAKA